VDHSFMGYLREDGKVATRNLVVVLPTVGCSARIATEIAAGMQGVAAYTHGQGCGQVGQDIEWVYRALAGLARNPNAGAVIFVGLGCETVVRERLLGMVGDLNKPVEFISGLEGGAPAAIEAGRTLAMRLAADLAHQQRERIPSSLLTLGLKCGGSDTTQGLGANPSLGAATDLLVAAGGTAILGETTEWIGAEHILQRRAASETLKARIARSVASIERRVNDLGVDMRGGQPTEGNITGGLTTIEEKALGSIAKSGTSPINGMCDYAEAPTAKGVVLMFSAGREPEILTGLAAGGAQVVAFTTGLGAPHGFPLVPVVKITANPRTATRLAGHIDIDVSRVISGTETLAQAGQRIYSTILEVCSGKVTKSEAMGYFHTDIWSTGIIL
jgi:altronate dehydratase large subunit